MNIRQATMNDFEVYSALFNSDDSDMLYRGKKSDVKPQNDSKDLIGLDDQTLALWNEELRRTPEKFKHILLSFSENRIYIVEDKAMIVGFFEMFRTVGTKWKLAFCGMKKGYRNQDAFTSAVKLLMQQKGVNSVDVCVVYRSCEQRMKDAGFTSIGGGFYRIETKKRE